MEGMCTNSECKQTKMNTSKFKNFYMIQKGIQQTKGWKLNIGEEHLGVAFECKHYHHMQRVNLTFLFSSHLTLPPKEYNHIIQLIITIKHIQTKMPYYTIPKNHAWGNLKQTYKSPIWLPKNIKMQGKKNFWTFKL